jgi:two-component system, response regulator PdtaR
MLLEIRNSLYQLGARAMIHQFRSDRNRLIRAQKPLRVLVVEDDALIALDYVEAIETHGGDVVGIADTPWQALTLAMQHRPDVAIVDIRLRYGGDGIDGARGIAALGTRIVFCSGNGDPATLERVRAFGEAKLLLKPVLMTDLVDALLS